MDQPNVTKVDLTSSKEKLTLSQSKLEKVKEMPNDVAVQIRCRKETARKYERKIEAFLSDLLKREKISKIQFVILDEKKDGSDEEDKSFFFNEDAAPLQNGDNTLEKLPFYDQSFDEPLGCDPENNEVQDENKTQARTCFNCLGNHLLKDCPQEHDGYRIANNRRNRMDNSTVRYHKDDAQLMENSNIRPGHISNALRNALNLKPNQLPTYIYTMRILGYPPGWMKEAEIESSGLTVYDSKGNAADSDEEGRAGKDSSAIKQYDGNKFISFPGFNTPVPNGVIDEYKKFQTPPLQKHQLLSEALKHKMVSIAPEYKKKRKTDTCLNQAKKDRNSHSDQTLKTPDKTQKTPDKTLKTPDQTPKNRNQEDSSSRRKSTSAVISGSPLINTENPYKKLPDSNKFAVGMSEYLPYENLPDAVGAFDKMRDVLDDVREKMSKH